MSGNIAATTTSSTDSQNSVPLSDPFVAVTVDGTSRQDSGALVEAPIGSAQLHVRRSARVASSRSRSTLASDYVLPAREIVAAPPGGKRRIGYMFEVLPPLAEDVGHGSRSVISVGIGGGSRDAANPQLGSPVTQALPTNRKRSASNAASGSGRRGPVPRPLASAADFSPTHFEEPRSDIMPPAHQPSAPPRSLPPSPMAVEPDDHQPATASHRTSSPASSPVSQNPLLQQRPSTVVHTPPPSRRPPQPFRTQDGMAAWAVAEGLHPIGEGFTAPGFVPAQVVGGVTYTVRSPQGRSPPIVQQTYSGRRLFSEHGDWQLQLPSRSLHPAAAGSLPLPPQLGNHVCYVPFFSAYILTLL